MTHSKTSFLEYKPLCFLKTFKNIRNLSKKKRRKKKKHKAFTFKGDLKFFQYDKKRDHFPFNFTSCA